MSIDKPPLFALFEGMGFYPEHIWVGDGKPLDTLDRIQLGGMIRYESGQVEMITYGSGEGSGDGCCDTRWTSGVGVGFGSTEGGGSLEVDGTNMNPFEASGQEARETINGEWSDDDIDQELGVRGF